MIYFPGCFLHLSTKKTLYLHRFGNANFSFVPAAHQQIGTVGCPKNALGAHAIEYINLLLSRQRPHYRHAVTHRRPNTRTVFHHLKTDRQHSAQSLFQPLASCHAGDSIQRFPLVSRTSPKAVFAQRQYKKLIPPNKILRQARGNKFEQFARSEEHTSELQSRPHLVCRLLLEKKKTKKKHKKRPRIGGSSMLGACACALLQLGPSGRRVVGGLGGRGDGSALGGSALAVDRSHR